MQKKDIKEVYSLGKKDFAKKDEYSWDWTIKEIKQYLKKSFGLGIICLDKNKIIGFLLLQRHYSHQKPKTSWLTYIFVEKNYRRKKIGSNLFNLSLLKLKQFAKKEMITDIYTKNKKSMVFFKSLGFNKNEEWVIERKIVFNKS